MLSLQQQWPSAISAYLKEWLQGPPALSRYSRAVVKEQFVWGNLGYSHVIISSFIYAAFWI
jgi:hypothetical protein